MPRPLPALFARAKARIRSRFFPSFPTAKFALAEARCKWLNRWKPVLTAKARASFFIIGCLVVCAAEKDRLQKLKERKDVKNAPVMERIQNPIFLVQAVMGWEQYKNKKVELFIN